MMGKWSYNSADELTAKVALVTLDLIGEIMSCCMSSEKKTSMIEGARTLCESLVDHIRTDKDKEENAGDEG